MSICFTKFNNDDIIKKLECGHIYHKYCIERFSQTQIRKDNYPLCLICFQWELQDNMQKKNQ